MSSDSTAKTIGVTLAVTIVASVIVSSLVVILRPIQEVNKAIDKKRNVLIAIGIKVDKSKVEEEFKKITSQVVDITTGDQVEGAVPADFDMGKVLRDPSQVITLAKKDDIAGIAKITKQQVVYLVRSSSGELQNLILPIYGKGLWSTMYGFIALKKDLNTVEGLTFYQHGETPGLGGEVDNPKWKDKWPGKFIYSKEGEIKVQIIKGAVTDKTPEKEFKVDGLSGATLTTRGVSNLIRFWVGDNGYGKFIAQLKSGGKSTSKTEPETNEEAPK